MEYFTVYLKDKAAVPFAVSLRTTDGGVEVTDLLGCKTVLSGRIVSVGETGVYLR